MVKSEKNKSVTSSQKTWHLEVTTFVSKR